MYSNSYRISGRVKKLSGSLLFPVISMMTNFTMKSIFQKNGWTWLLRITIFVNVTWGNKRLVKNWHVRGLSPNRIMGSRWSKFHIVSMQFVERFSIKCWEKPNLSNAVDVTKFPTPNFLISALPKHLYALGHFSDGISFFSGYLCLV